MVEEKTTDLFERVKSNLPDDAKISDIRFEGCEIVLYTKSKDFFTSDSTVIKDLVSSLKKRIILRPDPSICIDMEKATDIIKNLVPAEAGLKDLDFEPEFGEVTIEAEKPGLVIGKSGETLKEIKKQTLWLPIVKRAPVIPSDVVKVLRDLIHRESAFRKEFLDKVGKHIHSGWKPTDWIRLTALGGFREVGRSALLLQTPESRVLLDCGIKPGTNEYPYLNIPEAEISKLNAVVLSHSHMDHCIHPNTFIELPTGEITTVKDFYSSSYDGIVAVDIDNNLNLDAVACSEKVRINSPEFLYNIKTKTKAIKVTDNHPFFLMKGFDIVSKNASELKEGDFIAIIKEVNFKGEPQKLPSVRSKPNKSIKIKLPDFTTENICQFIGYLLGDGCKVDRRYKGKRIVRVETTDKNLENLKFYKEIAEEMLKIKGTIKQKERNRLAFHSPILLDFLKAISEDILCRSPQRKIPKIIHKVSLEQLAAFFRGLYDAEGSVGKHSLVLTSTSEELIKISQLLLLRFGIMSHIYEAKLPRTENKGFQLVIYHPESIKKFFGVISFSDKRKKEKLFNLTNKIGNAPSEKMDLIPIEKEQILLVSEKLGITRTELRNLNMNFYHYINGCYPSRKKIKELIKGLREKNKNSDLKELKDLEKIVNSNIVWEPVKKIEKVKSDTEFVYDLKVPGHHNYIANGIVVHNCGLIPYLYEMGFDGPLYLTAPTRDLMVLMCMDYIELTQREGKTPPYSTKGIKEAVKHSICLDYGEVSDITPDMRLTLLNSGHVLGGSLVHIHIGNGMHNLLYTGDMKFDRTALFEPASNDFQRAETVIIESTYGSQEDIMPKRQEAESQLVEVCKKTVERGGKCLIPSFAVERSQDVMAILSKAGFEYTIYLDGMVWDATAIHTAYPEYFNRDLQKLILQGSNPFTGENFKRIGSENERKKILESKDPCVIIATSGMLCGGPSVWWLKNLANDNKNSLVFIGFQGEGTLGKRIQKGWKEIPMEQGGKTVAVPINMEISTVSGLSGHSDYKQLINYLSRLKQRPERIIVDHGENSKCVEFARCCHSIFRCETLAPKLLETIRLK